MTLHLSADEEIPLVAQDVCGNTWMMALIKVQLGETPILMTLPGQVVQQV